MRSVPFVLAVAAFASACQWDPMFLEHQSTLYTSARGVALDTDPSGNAQVGMNGTTCAVDTAYGTPSTDYDYPGTDEEVDDVSDDGVVVITGDDKVHLQHSDGWTTSSEDYDVPAAQVSVALDDGAVTYGGDDDRCALTWVGQRDAVSDLPPAICGSRTDVAADPTDGTTYVGTTIGTYEVEPGEAPTTISEEPAELIAYDLTTELLYTAEVEGSVVRAIDTTGSEAWVATIDGAVIALDDMGAEAAVAVSVARADGTGGIVVLDGFTGIPSTSLSLPTPGDEVVGSNDGGQIAVVGDGQVGFFGVASLW